MDAIKITTRHLDVQDDVKSMAREKFGKLDRFFHGVQRVEVILKLEDRRYHCEAIMHVKNKGAVVIDVVREDLREAIDVAVDKCERQLRRLKEKITGRRRESTAAMKHGADQHEESGEVEGDEAGAAAAAESTLEAEA